MEETGIWKVEHELAVPAANLTCKVVEGATQYPQLAEEMEIELWNSAVNAKAKELEGDELELRVMKVEGRDALWVRRNADEEFAMAMHPGLQFRFAGMHNENVLLVEKVIYSEIEALKSQEYRKLFEDAGLPIPNGPLAPVAYIFTADDKIVLSIRGKATNKYPGGVWGIGGDVDDSRISIGEHLMFVEQKEEIKLEKGTQSHALALGIIFDKVLRKHELPALVRYNGNSTSVTKNGAYLPDVDLITSVPAAPGMLAECIAGFYVESDDASDRSFAGKLTPGCSAGLYLVGKHIHGEEWAEAVLERLSGK